MTTITRMPAFVIADLPKLTGWEARTDAAITQVRELLRAKSFDKPLPKKPRAELKDFSFPWLHRAVWTAGGVVAGAFVGAVFTAVGALANSWVPVFLVPVAIGIGATMGFEKGEARGERSVLEAARHRRQKEWGYRDDLAAWKAERDARARVDSKGRYELWPLMDAIDDAPDAPARDHAIRTIAGFADDLLRNHAPELGTDDVAWLKWLVDWRNEVAIDGGSHFSDLPWLKWVRDSRKCLAATA